MKLLVSDLLNAYESLNKIFLYPMPIKLSYRLTKIATKVVTEVDRFDKKRMELVQKYGAKNEKGNVQVTKEMTEEFSKAMSPLLAEEIEVSIDLIPQSLLEESGIKLSPQDLVVLDKFIQKEEVNSEANKS